MLKFLSYLINIIYHFLNHYSIGRVGRAERMGLAISLVSSVNEKVWYHSCPSRGKSCNDTRLKGKFLFKYKSDISAIN